MDTLLMQDGITHEEARLRVAYVLPRFSCGGYQRCIAHFVNHLDRRRFQPMIICLDRSGSAEEWIKVDDVPIIELHKKPGNDLRIVSLLAAVLRERNVDLVQSHNWGTLVETSLARKRATTAVHVHAERGTVMGELQSRGIRHRLRAFAMNWALKRADLVISNAAAVAQRVQEKCGYPADRIRLVPNGIERPEIVDAVADRQAVRDELGIGHSAHVVGSVGRLHSVKGFNLAVRLVADLAKQSVDVHLILVGEGEERESLQQLAFKLGVAQRVHLVGYHANIGRWLNAMDVYANTSHSEGMSQSLVEAMSVGLPLVVTDVGDSARMVGGPHACGIIVKPASVPEISSAVADVLRDKHHRETLGAFSSQRYATRFHIQTMIEEYESLYTTLIDPRKGTTVATLQEQGVLT